MWGKRDGHEHASLWLWPFADAAGVSRWQQVRSRFDAGPGTLVTVAAATGGHVAAVERFAVTAVRTG